MSELRKSGIEVLGDIPWGSHFCQFYETKKDLLELLVPYFKAGLENNEFCLWITCDPVAVEDAFEALRRDIPNFDRYLEKQSIEILPYMDWYLKTGKFNGKIISDAWLQKLRGAVDSGYEGMRVNGNETWLESEDWDNFMKYEKDLNNTLVGKRMIVLCTYPLSNAGAGTLLDVAHAHECVISKRKGHWKILEEPEIKKIKSELKKEADELEQRVAERTKELAIVVDELKKEIGERRKSQALFEEEKKLSDEIIDSIPALFALFDENLHFVRWNKNFETVSGYAREEILKLHGIESFFDNGEDKRRTSRILAEIFEKGSGSGEVSPLMKDGKPIHLFFIGRSFKYEGKTYLITTGIDITELKQTENELQQSFEEIRRLTEHLQTIREEERKYIAREIHDELGQQLTAIKMDVAWVDKKIPAETFDIKRKLKNIITLLDGSNQSIRRILSELRPQILGDHGLLEAIEWLGMQVTETTGIAIKFTTPEKDIKVSEQIATNIFRICQEAFTNITRHSHAKNISVSISIVEENIILSIEDDGIGFDPASVQNIKSFGILGMRERVISLGAKFDLVSSPGGGTKITVCLPYKE